VSTLYAHASQLLVHQGDKVAAGTPLARVGHTGRSTGPHLHFEVRMAGTPTDPVRGLMSFAGRAD
jgi:murein DD-endopeptidase MepM/ murein hydrolase activator NlpD